MNGDDMASPPCVEALPAKHGCSRRRGSSRDTDRVYIPDHFRPADEDVAELLANIGAADLVTATADGLLATMLPLIHEPARPSTQAGGAHGRLMGHVARNNRQWKVPPIGGAMVIVRGPDAYISPAWYAAKRRARSRRPDLELHHGPHPRRARDPRRSRVGRGQRPRPDRSSRGGAARAVVGRRRARPYIEGQLRAIVGVEILISRIEAKFKLSQNRSTADVDGAIAGLLAGPAIGNPLAAAMEAVRRRR